jgi:hypothetical protein
VTKGQRILIAWLICNFAIGAVSKGLDFLGGSFDFGLIGLSMTAFTYLWCRADSRVSHGSVSPYLRMLVVILSPIGIPIYMMRTRGSLRGALFGTLNAVIFYLAACAALIAGIEFSIFVQG